MSQGWYLLQCKPGQVPRAEEHLARQGYHTFLPRIAVERLRRQQRVQLEEPLFPGYLFIQLDNVSDNWAPIRSTRGVSRFVAFNGQPAQVADAVVDAIRERVQQQAAAPMWQPGERVRLADGPFSQLEAIFQCFDGDQRAIILLTLLQRQHTLAVPVGHLQKVIQTS